MSEVKWIKLNPDFFNDVRIKFIERRIDDGDTINLFWIFLLMKAGKTNKNGSLLREDGTPYTFDQLADKFGINTSVLQIAIKEFKKLGMLEIDNSTIRILNCEEWFILDKSCVIRSGDWKNLRQFILERDRFICQYCGDKEGPFEADHVIPRAKGGLDTEENLVCACRSCNRSKRDKSLEEWRNSR